MVSQHELARDRMKRYAMEGKLEDERDKAPTTTNVEPEEKEALEKERSDALAEIDADEPKRPEQDVEEVSKSKSKGPTLG